MTHRNGVSYIKTIKMKKRVKIFILLFILLITQSAFSQSLYWQRIYGLNAYKNGTCGLETLDGNYLIISHWNISAVNRGINIIKINPFGINIWEKNYNVQTFDDIIVTSDSGYILVGSGIKAAIFKISMSGDSLWYKEYGTSIDDRFVRIKKSGESDFIICGRKSTGTVSGGAYILKISGTGDTLWQKTIKDSLYTDIRAFDLIVEDSGNIAVTCWAIIDFKINNDIFFFKLTSEGNLYKKIFIHTPEISDGGSRIMKLTDGNYIISGFTHLTPPPYYCSHFTKIDLILQKLYRECTFFINKTIDNNYISHCLIINLTLRL